MRVVLRVLASVLLVLALACTGTWLYARSDHGRRALAQRIAHVVSEEIPGTMTIGRLEQLSLRTAEVSDLRFLHPDGSLILRVKHATIELDLGAALHRELAFKGARVHGGFLLIGARPSGRTGLEETFSKPSESKETGAQAQHRHGLRMQLRDLRVRDMTVALRPSPEHATHIEHVSAVVGIEHLDTPGVHVRLERVAGHVPKPKFLGAELDIVSAEGWVHGAEPHVIDLALDARLGKGELDGHLALFRRKEKPVELTLIPKGGAVAHAGALAAEVGSWFTDKVHVDIKKS